MQKELLFYSTINIRNAQASSKIQVGVDRSTVGRSVGETENGRFKRWRSKIGGAWCYLLINPH